MKQENTQKREWVTPKVAQLTVKQAETNLLPNANDGVGGGKGNGNNVQVS